MAKEKLLGQYIFSLTELGKEAIQNEDYAKAIELLTNARVYPENLGEGKLQGAAENELLYLLGVANEKLNNATEAKAYFNEAAIGLNEVSGAMFYNDQQPDTIFYKGLALKKLGDEKAAQECFDKLIAFGEKHQNDHMRIDYFAVSLPDLLIWEDSLDARNNLLCRYLMGLGYLGKGANSEAETILKGVLNDDPAHPKAGVFLKEQI